ncbi:MAG: hypothetical protein AB1492_04990 [Bacillota bacterium]
MSQIPEGKPSRAALILPSLAKALADSLRLILLIVLVVGVAYLTGTWAARQELSALTGDLAAAQRDLELRVKALEAASAGQHPQVADADTLATLQASVAELDRAWREVLPDQPAVALTASLDLRTSLFKAQGEVLKVKIDLAEANFGKAGTGLAHVEGTLKGLLPTVTEPMAGELQALSVLARDARKGIQALSPGVPEAVDLLWQRLNAVLGSLGNR